MSVQGPQPWAGPYSAFVGVGGIRGENAPLLAVTSRGAGQQLSVAGRFLRTAVDAKQGGIMDRALVSQTRASGVDTHVETDVPSGFRQWAWIPTPIPRRGAPRNTACCCPRWVQLASALSSLVLGGTIPL